MPTSQDLGSVRQAQDIIHTIRDQHASNKPKEKWNKIDILYFITLSLFYINICYAIIRPSRKSLT